jgi:hypothetical protein
MGIWRFGEADLVLPVLSLVCTNVWVVRSSFILK